MNTNRIFLFLGISTLALTSACSSVKPNVDNAQYWQRAHASETTYINGPKAQQMLNRDISRCVTELRELERLGQVKDAIPTNIAGRVLNPDELELRKIDTPERDSYLFSEHGNYQDFEGCMFENGWERTRTISYEATKRAEENFFANHIDFLNKKGTFQGPKGDDTSLGNDQYND